MSRAVYISLFALTAFILSTSFSSQERDSHYIYWDQRKLTWDDFKGRRPSSTPYTASTSSAIQFGFSGENSTIQCSILTLFDPKDSWKKKEVTDHLLNHEQRHFDITEIYARVLRKAVHETTFKNYNTLSTELQKIYQKAVSDCNKFQDLYDRETDHSKKKDDQAAWDLKIDTMLDSLKDWQMTEFTLDVGYLIKN